MTPILTQAIEWPTVQVGRRLLTFRMSYAAHFQLQKWGMKLTDPNTKTTDFDVAAACAGTFDKQGNWQSLGLTPVQLADLVSMQPNADDLALEVQTAAVEAAKKASPGLVPFLQPKPGSTAGQTKTGGSQSGPSEPPEAVSA